MDKTHKARLDKFLALVEIGAKDECWLFTGNQTWNGYGVFTARWNDRPYWRAHRFAYAVRHGAVPNGQNVLHRCDVRLCVNPRHLFAGTQRENVDDQIAKGRRPWGETHGRCRFLTADDVHAIRESNERHAVLARRYGVTGSHIMRIRQRKMWAKLPARV